MAKLSASEKEKTKLRERNRRSITTKIFHGLRKYGGYNLAPRADINEVLRCLAVEAGWTVEEDGTTYRTPAGGISSIREAMSVGYNGGAGAGRALLGGLTANGRGEGLAGMSTGLVGSSGIDSSLLRHGSSNSAQLLAMGAGGRLLAGGSTLRNIDNYGASSDSGYNSGFHVRALQQQQQAETDHMMVIQGGRQYINHDDHDQMQLADLNGQLLADIIQSGGGGAAPGDCSTTASPLHASTTSWRCDANNFNDDCIASQQQHQQQKSTRNCNHSTMSTTSEYAHLSSDQELLFNLTRRACTALINNTSTAPAACSCTLCTSPSINISSFLQQQGEAASVLEATSHLAATTTSPANSSEVVAPPQAGQVSSSIALPSSLIPSYVAALSPHAAFIGSSSNSPCGVLSAPHHDHSVPAADEVIKQDLLDALPLEFCNAASDIVGASAGQSVCNSAHIDQQSIISIHGDHASSSSILQVAAPPQGLRSEYKEQLIGQKPRTSASSSASSILHQPQYTRDASQQHYILAAPPASTGITGWSVQQQLNMELPEYMNMSCMMQINPNLLFQVAAANYDHARGASPNQSTLPQLASRHQGHLAHLQAARDHGRSANDFQRQLVQEEARASNHNTPLTSPQRSHPFSQLEAHASNHTTPLASPREL